jgi:hypothetical protein
MKYLSLLLLSLCIISCGSNDDTATTINFKLKYGADDLVMFSNFDNDQGMMIRITDVKGFTSDFTLISGDASEVISEVKFLELGDAHSDVDEAAEGYNWTVDTELQEIDQVNFNIGIPNALNETVPADYNSSSDLSRASEYWTNWESYIYFKIEGNADFDGNGLFESGENIVLHLGTERAYRNVSLNKSNDDNVIALELDIEKVLSNYDLEGMPTIHTSLSDAVRSNIDVLAENISQAFQ